jgi:hypothetical protein
MKVFLDFEDLISPLIIKIIYWIGMVLVVIAAVVGFVTALISGQLGGAFACLVFVVLGPILVRVYAELLMLAFKMYDTLKEIRNNTKR